MAEDQRDWTELRAAVTRGHADRGTLDLVLAGLAAVCHRSIAAATLGKIVGPRRRTCNMGLGRASQNDE